jgi:hypothetical protein
LYCLDQEAEYRRRDGPVEESPEVLA